MPEETVEEKEVKAPAKARGGSSIVKIVLIILLALVSSAGGGFVSFVLISRSLNPKLEDKAEKAKEAEQEKIEKMLQKSGVLPLEPFVVNLADADAARYLRIKISLMIDDKNKAKEITENQPLQLKVRDVILQSLSAKNSRELLAEEGKNKLRHELQEKVSLYFREPKLVDVVFTEFVIQL